MKKKIITAGVDEVGRGCLAGPVVSAAVILKQGINLNLLKDSNLVESTSEAFRMIKQGAVKMDGEKINEKDLTPNEGTSVYQVGKRKFARVTIS